MRYLELGNPEKETALIDYCGLMQINLTTNKDKVVKWFIEKNHNVFNSKGFLKHRKL
jgi:hypothetical protein